MYLHEKIADQFIERFVEGVKRLVRELKFGEIYVNRAGGDAVHAYHSGYRHSGIGGEDGKYGLEGYLRKKTIYVNYS
jgi:lactaldehyde dehydrogenase/glycolaldehyde dehydrogenase